MNFIVDKSNSYPSHYSVNITKKVHDIINTKVRGSYLILFARLFGLEYHSFCRYVRDIYGATLHGRQEGYITFTFEQKQDAEKFQREVEHRWKER